MSTENATNDSTQEEPRLKSTGTEDKDQSEDQAKSAASDDEEESQDKIPFPVILHEIVCDPATDHCIHWLPNSNLFTIADKKKFAKEVLPKLNGHAKFTSFTRRLKRWGFSRIASGPQIGSYQNPDFIREDPERVRNIKYMHPKQLSTAAIQRNNAKLQAAAKLNLAAAGFDAQPPQDLRMLQTLIAQQQQMGQAANPAMEAYMRLANSGNDLFSQANNLTAPANNQSMAMQLAMLQEMQNQHNMQKVQSANSAAAMAASAPKPESPKINETFGEKLVRTNPSLAAQLIDYKCGPNNSALQGMAANNASALLPAQNINQMQQLLSAQNFNQMQQQNVNASFLQQMGNQEGGGGGNQQNLTAMMYSLLQQEQQQQQLQQQKDFIKNFMSGQLNQDQNQAPPANDRSHSRRDSSLLVTPSSSAPSLQVAGMKSSNSDENWLSALLNRGNNNSANSNQLNTAGPKSSDDGGGKKDSADV